MSDKSDAIAGLEAARKETLEAINGIPEEKMSAVAFGSWSVKDVLCHLASWEQFAVPDLQRISRGHIPQLATLRLEDVDDWNAGLMRSRNLFPLPQVMFELEDSRRQFIDALNAQPEGVFATGQMVRMLTDGLVNGEKGHAADIREWRQQEGI
ncbi:MAG: DinB family protein [Chloroflexi bacterium]|nr:DinB family protein [Chloroflexota bacterium]